MARGRECIISRVTTAAILGLYLFSAFAGWMVVQLLRQNGRILLRLEALEARLAVTGGAGRPAGLTPGTAAPSIELPMLDGGSVTLDQFRGRRLLLVFFDPQCGFCQQMAPQVAEMQRQGTSGLPALLFVSTGDSETNRRLFAEHRIDAVVGLQQQQREVLTRYQATGTPTGYLIDEHGAIASDLAVGARALLALAAAQGELVHRGNRPLSTSRIRRDGLPAGSIAPPFSLPRVGGGTVALADYRGQPVLLVLSDPHCGPCQQLAPKLQEVHRAGGDARIVMISRGDEGENQRKIIEHGLTFPVGLQPHWEVSRAYGMFATPIAFLIDENGVIARDVAVGSDAILSLLDVAHVAG